MPKPDERLSLQLADDAQRFVDATWSRSGKHVIVSVGKSWDAAGQVELTREQADRLAAFLAAGPD